MKINMLFKAHIYLLCCILNQDHNCKHAPERTLSKHLTFHKLQKINQIKNIFDDQKHNLRKMKNLVPRALPAAGQIGDWRESELQTIHLFLN